MRSLFYSIGILLAAMPIQLGFAQSCCSGGVPLSGNLGLAGSDQGAWQFMLTYDLNVLQDLLSETELLQDNTRTRTTHSMLWETNYGISPRWTATALLSVVRQQRTVNSFDVANFTAVQGLGDGYLLLKYRITRPTPDARTNWIVGAGPKFPLGRTNFRNALDLELPADMQPGTGSWDGLLWSYLNYSDVVIRDLSLTVLSQYRYTGANPNFRDVQRYEFGNEFQLNAGLIQRVLWRQTALDPLVLLRYRTVDRDQVDNNPIPSTGGHWLYAGAGINVSPTPQWSARLVGEYPLYRNLNGTQLSTSYKVYTSLVWSLPRKDKSGMLKTPIP